VINPDNHCASLSNNRNPHLAWSDAPQGTKFVLICHESDVPGRADDVNKEDREVPISTPRIGSPIMFLLYMLSTHRISR
jgi:hypothetical protein